jgi:exodeoxyribonuclease X
MVVIDTETTGLGKEDQVIELAAAWEGGHNHFLVKPSVPVSPEARAVHHIPDKVLDNCGNAATWRPYLGDVFARHPGPLVGHNVAFDIGMIKQTWPDLWVEEPAFICTYQCARHLWPEAPAHGNQVLRYWLGLRPTIRTNLPPHRALPDVAVTQALLLKMLERCDAEELVRLSKMPVLLRQVKFGKHRGALWESVPRDYFQWILRNGEFDADTIHTARYYLGMTP